MQFRRQYQPREIDWLLLRDLLDKYRYTIPGEKLGDEFELQPVPKFEVATSSQKVVGGKLDDFIEFIQTSPEPPEEVEIRLDRYYGSPLLGKYAPTESSYLKFAWSEKGVSVQLDHASIQSALSFLEEFEGILKLDPAEPEPEAPRRTVFISHAIDEVGHSYASRLKEFLSLLEFDVATGGSFSPEKISDKVKRRLEAQDIVFIVFSEKKDTTWLIQEMTAASLQEKHLFILLEKGAEFKSGILGDIEYIPFEKGRICDCFIHILEGFRELRFCFSYDSSSLGPTLRSGGS